MSKQDPSYDDIVRYVDACEQMAISLANDLKKGDKISVNTILTLNKYTRLALKLKKMLVQVEQDKLKLNN